MPSILINQNSFFDQWTLFDYIVYLKTEVFWIKIQLHVLFFFFFFWGGGQICKSKSINVDNTGTTY